MMSARKLLFTGLVISGFIHSGCKKEQQSKTVEGKIVLVVHVSHHNTPVPDFPVYLKFNTGTYPGRDSTQYDVRILSDGNGKAFFTKLTPGNHYLYGYGMDALAGANVIGYHPLIISSSTVLNDTVTTQLYVSE